MAIAGINAARRVKALQSSIGERKRDTQCCQVRAWRVVDGPTERIPCLYPAGWATYLAEDMHSSSDSPLPSAKHVKAYGEHWATQDRAIMLTGASLGCVTEGDYRVR